MKPIKVVDSHTAGEPTRVIVEGGPDLGTGTVAERLEIFRAQHDRFRSAVVGEPRGSDVLVGAILLEPADKTCDAGVIFYNNVSFLGMCGHGTIGVVVTLRHLGRLSSGKCRLETPVGVVSATLNDDGSVSVENVASHHAAAMVVDVPGVGPIRGDVAYGGNWFFLTEEHGVAMNLDNVDALTDRAWRIRQAVNAQGHPAVDHIELLGHPTKAGAHGRSFVLCPGKAYDRSPCGTGTSAKLACLAAHGHLGEGEEWVQESIIGSLFSARYRRQGDGHIIPTITGSAYVNAESTLLLDERDPFCWGIR
jgi:4-hydroxyproline epimerase